MTQFKYPPIVFLSISLLLAACTSKSADTTKVVGQFAENVPETVRFTRGYYNGGFDEEHFVSFFDTTVAVVNGGFEVEIPRCMTSMTDLKIGDDIINFISDGTTITIDQEARIAVSSDEKGVHSRYMDFARRWNDYQTQIAGFGSDVGAREKYRDENLGTLLDYMKEAARNNPDNFIGMQALQMLHLYQDEVSPEEMLSMVNDLSDEIKTDPMSSVMFSELSDFYNGRVKSLEGKPFVDFTVIQDPEHPETSTVKLSDYVGKGKYVLVDFWASWCGPCKAEMPNLISVYNTYHSDKFDMLSVAVADKVEETVKAAKELGITWNQIVNAQQIPVNAYGFDAIPFVVLFGPDGTILKRDLRGEQIGEAVREALGV